MSHLNVNLSDVYFPENIYAAWLSVSFILMTLSLLFYHMARVSSIEMNTKIAGVYAIILILISGFLSFISIFPYYTRFTKIYHMNNKSNFLNDEFLYHKLYIACGIIVILVQLLISFTIIKIEFF